MRIDIVDLIPQIDTNLGGAFVGGTMNVQTVKPPYDALRFECTVTGEEMTGLMSGEIDKVEFAKEKIKGHLELDVEKVGAFEIETYNREQKKQKEKLEELEFENKVLQEIILDTLI